MTLKKNPIEAKRDELHGKIIQSYSTMREKNPDAAPSRIMTAIANEYGYTAQGVRKILEKNNIDITKK